MPIWWVGLCGIVGLVIGLLFNIGWLKFFGVISLISAGLGLVFGLLRRRT